jgi:DNA-binding MarR family transcriptional regulator
MTEEWENIVIETGIDTLMTYLSQHGKASLATVSSDTGISQQRLKNWADSLEQENLLQKNYTYRNGIVLEYNEENKQETEERKEELEEDLEEHSDKLSDEMQERLDNLRNAKSELRTIAVDLEEQQDDEDEIKQKIDEVEEMEEKLQEQVEDLDDLEEEDVKVLADVEKTLQNIEEIETTDFNHSRDEVRSKIKALGKLQEHLENYEKNVEDQPSGIIGKIKSHLPFGSSSSTAKKEGSEESEETSEQDSEDETSSEIEKTPEINDDTEIEEVDEPNQEDSGDVGKHPITVDHIENSDGFIHMLNNSNVDQAKEMIQMIENPDYEKLLELEEKAKDRKTLKSWLEKRIDN